MTHARLSAVGRRPDCEASHHAKKLFHAPLFAVGRKELLKAARDAVRALGLDRSERQLIECLAVCFGEQQFAKGLLCWPSNEHIESKTGMSERTIRRSIEKLRQCGLIVMRDSANGKRFPISNAKGEIVDARGFDLTPLHARVPEFAERARALDIEDRVRRQLRDDLTAVRNATFDLCAVDPSGVYAEILARARAIGQPLKHAAPEEFAAAIEAFLVLADDARELRYEGVASDETTAYAGHFGRHSEQDSEPFINNCNEAQVVQSVVPASPSPRTEDTGIDAFRAKQGGAVRQNEQTIDNANKAVPKDLALWLGACPELSDFGTIATIERAAVAGAQLIRACGLAQHAFDGAAARLGLVNVGLLGLSVCQRHADGERSGGTPIRSPGGLFVMLAREIERGRPPLDKELLAMQRRRRARSLYLIIIGASAFDLVSTRCRRSVRRPPGASVFAGAEIRSRHK